MRRIVIFISAIFLLLGMTGCGNSSSVQTPSDASEESSTAQPEQNESGPVDREENETMNISVKSADHELIYELNNSQAAKELYAQLPLTMEVEPFSNNEMTFYPPQKLDTSGAPLSGGEAGSLSYYEPWGDVVFFYDDYNENPSLFELGQAVSGAELISEMAGTITLEAAE